MHRVGSRGSKFRLGLDDRVGVICMVNSCRTCENCRKGLENYCLDGHNLTYNSPDPETGPGCHTFQLFQTDCYQRGLCFAGAE